jgi:Protein of unknown function (DUF742)
VATPPGGHSYGVPQQPDYADPYGQNYGGQNYGGGRPPRRYNFPSAPTPHQAPEPVHEQRPLFRPMPEQPQPAAAPAAASGTDQPLVRPYAMTGGRTKPRYQLAIEALISTVADPSHTAGLLPEHQRICHLCREIKSVAEISALLSIPLGVARILVADLAEAGMVAIHQPAGADDPGAQPDLTLLERVLSGLRKL